MPEKLFGWLDFGGSALSSVANVISSVLTNRSNQRIAAAQNAMQVAENEKAYQRSKASNQVNLMRDAGMSKAGALSALNGGGSYQPAPMTSIPNQAPQIDLSSAFDGLIQIGENAKQRKMQEDMLDKQLKYNAEQADKQRDHELLLSDIQSGNQVQHDYLEYQKHKERLKFDYANAHRNWRIIDKQVAHLEKQTEYIDVQIKGAELDNLRKQLENENYSTLAKLANEKMQAEINSLILSYNQAVENHTLDKERKELENKWTKLTQESGIKAENIRNELEAYMDTVHLSANTPAGGFLACLELFVNNYLPTLARVK